MVSALGGTTNFELHDAGEHAVQAFVYQRLHAIAHGQLIGGKRFAQTTSLVHEAYLRLAPSMGITTTAISRSHFFAIAATAMRQILIDRARAAFADKRGSGQQALSLSLADAEVSADDPASLLQIDHALAHVREADPRLATLVELKIFGGMDVPELADALEVSERSVKRYWRQARALLMADYQ